MENNIIELKGVSPRLEMGAYEALFLEKGATFKRLADKFKENPNALPSDFVSKELAEETAKAVIRQLESKGITKFGIRVNKTGDYPEKLRDAKNPIELLYFKGCWELVEMRSLAIIGSRKASPEGINRAGLVAREIVQNDFAVVSGLASGIDTASHRATLEANGSTIAVIGTPLGDCYPKEHKQLQDEIASEHLLISQIPVLKYAVQPFNEKKYYFPERNATMSAITEGTVIVEANENSGTLTQARAVLYQGRKLFILENNFLNEKLTWPRKFEEMGAIRVKDPDDIWKALEQNPDDKPFFNESPQQMML